MHLNKIVISDAPGAPHHRCGDPGWAIDCTGMNPVPWLSQWGAGQEGGTPPVECFTQNQTF